MTILEAIQTAIDNLDGVRLPVRDSENANRIRSSLGLLDAMRDYVTKQSEQPEQAEADETQTEGADGQ